MKQRQHAPRQPWTDERKAEAVAQYRAGMTIAEVAENMQTSSRHVRAALHAAGAVRDKRILYRGSGNPAWKGGRTTDKSGYILVYRPDHPDANSNGYIREHRLVMEQALGRRLDRHEVVHHRDRKHRSDNQIGNLRLHATNADHLRQELKGKCPHWSAAGKASLRAAARRKHLAAQKRRSLATAPD
jgi:HNH endonuclease